GAGRRGPLRPVCRRGRRTKPMVAGRRWTGTRILLLGAARLRRRGRGGPPAGGRRGAGAGWSLGRGPSTSARARTRCLPRVLLGGRPPRGRLPAGRRLGRRCRGGCFGLLEIEAGLLYGCGGFVLGREDLVQGLLGVGVVAAHLGLVVEVLAHGLGAQRILARVLPALLDAFDLVQQPGLLAVGSGGLDVLVRLGHDIG